jgi:Chitobiase/beta-hexosaminidase C-terminal domain
MTRPSLLLGFLVSAVAICACKGELSIDAAEADGGEGGTGAVEAGSGGGVDASGSSSSGGQGSSGSGGVQGSSGSSGGGSGSSGSSSSGSSSSGGLCSLGKPTFTPPGGTTFTGSGFIVINSPPEFPMDGVVFYTTDQTVPTHASKALSGPIQVDMSETIAAIATAPGCADSPIAFATYSHEAPDQ